MPFLFFNGISFAQQISDDDLNPKVILILIDRVSWHDIPLAKMPNLTEIIRQSSIGLMTTNSFGGRNIDNGFATISAGRAAVAGSEATFGANGREIVSDEEAYKTHQRRTGLTANPEAIVFVGLSNLKQANKAAGTLAYPGIIGSEMNKRGKIAVLLGNADNIGMQRQSVLIPMDMNGIIPYGDVSTDTNKQNAGRLLRWSSDYAHLKKKLDQYYPIANLIVIHLGDTTRLDSFEGYAEPEVMQLEAQKIWKEIDAFLKEVINKTSAPDTILLLCGVQPSNRAQAQKNFLVPILLYDKNSEPSLLTSGTTRRLGIVSNQDIAPTILNYLHIETPSEIVGKRIFSSDAEIMETVDRVIFIENLNNRLVFISNLRPLVVRPYVIAQIIIMGAALLAVFLRKSMVEYFKYILLFLMSIPFCMLIIGAYIDQLINMEIAYFFLLIALAGLLAGFAGRVSKISLAPFVLISSATAIAIVFDLLAGSKLMQSSVLGYDPMAGARFYGIGNEYMGVLIGSAIMAGAGIIQIIGTQSLLIKPIAFFCAITITFLISSPEYGANFGGTIAAIVGFSVWFVFISNLKNKITTLASLAGVSLLYIFFIYYFDAKQPPEHQSHIGRALNLMFDGKFLEISRIISRKLTMNIRLIRYTIWSRVFLISVTAVTLLFFRPAGVFAIIRKKLPFFSSGYYAILAAALAALIFNDSGIVAAATMMIYGAAPMIFLVLMEKKQGQTN